ncbi:zinc finger protein 318 isoform X2 [Parambassis ranga]|uniref:Zinc finger protein 318 isoform X2 n=1 Tax=Parambassis ranga TaxID=210632 RepID=A0A6P7JTD2_9TELE|nr:zinc finger protein 318 isoform X2 [Parambassis ranga]
MYRGRPPPRGGYPPPFEGRGPPPSRPYPPPVYRGDRDRPRPPYHPGYNDYGHTDSYRRSPPHKRYPSPGSGSHRPGEYWAGGQPRERSPRGSVPLDHNLVITVGNELTGPAGSAPSRHHDRDYPPRPEYEHSHSRGRSPDKSRGRSKTRSPDRSRAKSRGRSKSRAHSQSRSPDRSRGRSKTRSPDRSRAKSRGRSKSRAHSQSRSPDRSRAKSRGRSKSRPRSWSRSKSRSRSRSRGRSRGRSHARSKSRHRSRSVSSSSSSSSSHSGRGRDEKSVKGFKELEMARRRKELEEMLSQPTKSILKKRSNAEDSPSLRVGQGSDSPRGLDSSNMSRVADQLLQAVKGMDSHTVASMLSELQSDPHMAHRSGLNAEIKEILNLLGGSAQGAGDQQKAVNDIDDEEKFLYGDSEDPKPAPAPEPVSHYGLNLYGDVTEETLYGDYPPQKPLMGQMYSCPAGAATHLQGPSTVSEGDTRYVSQPTMNPPQNITVQVSNPAYPPGTEPLDESERQALEEYEKIQDLLKTIGLDLGVTEISKMAARTKERLHGNKPPPKIPTHRRRYSSGSSDGSRKSRRRRSHSSSSSSSSRSHGRRASGSSGEGGCGNASAPFGPLKDRDVKETKAERGDAALPPQMPEPSVLPVHPSLPVPTYPPPQIHAMIPPNFPPPGFNQYGNFLPYMHQQWPPMYPPPNLNLPPPTDFPPTLPYQPAPESGFKGVVTSSEGGNRRVSEEQNNESQKQKVLEEREKLKQERDIRMKKKEYLMKELERLRKQQGELLRKKRREKDGHKDPLLQEISHLQEEVMSQISNLRKEHEAAEKTRNEIDKVALILGLSPSDRPLRTSKLPEDQEEEPPPLEKKKRESERSPDGRAAPSSTRTKPTSVALSPSRASPVTTAVAAPPPDPFEYYDAGNHWCKNCNVTCGSMFDFFTHLHSKTHRKTLDPYDRPWASTPPKLSKNTGSEEKLTKPAKGSEFLLPVRGLFCLLCKEFYGDAICAEEHVTTHAHNEKYKKQMYENPLYEQRRNLDRQAGLASEATGRKRKHDDEDKGGKDKEDKFKQKKEKKDKEKKKEDSVQAEEKSKGNKEEEEEKLKCSKKEEKLKNVKSLEQEKPPYSRDDRYRYSREEEERDRYSRRDEDDRHRYSREEEYRCRYRRDEDGRAKHGPRDDEDKYKSNKSSDVRCKYGKDQDEDKPKAERTAFKKLESEKPAANMHELPPKPYDPPKIFCGPSPAMRAKLRKQSQEASKPAATSTTTSFGKFTWKKKENILAKEAQKVAAEFIKEDEAAVKEQPVSVEDSFAKSVAAAQKIAQKLADQTSEPTAWSSSSAGRGRIRPNLPAPAAVLRKTTMMGRPAPLNTFLSIRPQSSNTLGSPPKPDFCDPLIKAQSAQKDLPEVEPIPPPGRPGPFEAVSAQGPRPQLLGARPAPYEVRPAPPVCKPPERSAPVPAEAKPVPAEIKHMPPTVPPAQPTIVKIVSDVAAPGVPESEQTRTVFVKPPPLNLGDHIQKSEKHKSNLAAAKAQDLFGIFYSSISHSGPPSFAKPATDTRADRSSPSPLPALKAPRPQAKLPTPSQPLPELHACPQPRSSTPPPSPQQQTKPDIQIESVWSLQSSAGPDHELAPPKHISQTKDPQTPQPLLAQSEGQSEPRNQSLATVSESHPQTTSAKLESTPLTESQPKFVPQIQNESHPEHKPETYPDTASEPEPKPAPKTRGKKTPPAPRPARQTRSQTRYQTRQQQSQSELEPLLASGDSADSDPKGLNTSDPSSESQQEVGTTSEEDTQMTAITPETLGLPSDMTSLDFEYDFNFE